jgi:ribosomal protein S30
VKFIWEIRVEAKEVTQYYARGQNKLKYAKRILKQNQDSNTRQAYQE